MPKEDIESSHAHLPNREVQAPLAPRRGLLGRIFRFLWPRDLNERWQVKTPKSDNWTSERGSFDPSESAAEAKKRKRARPVTNPLSGSSSSEVSPKLTAQLQERFPKIGERTTAQLVGYDSVAGELIDVLKFLRDDSQPQYSFADQVTAIDWPEAEEIEVVYFVRSVESGERVTIHVRTSRNSGKLPTACEIYPGFSWHEREVQELFGVVFEGHPDPRKLLLDTTYAGSPMLKDYDDPEHEFVKRPY